MSQDRMQHGYRPDGTWSCTRDDVSSPCGNCDGCRQAQNLAADDGDIPPGLLLSIDSRGGFAVPRQLAGRPAGTGR
jgi:hypothetical protein